MSRMNPQHRAEILAHMRALEYDRKTVTLMHRNLGAPDRFQGRAVDEWLDSLTFDEGTQVLDKARNLAA